LSGAQETKMTLEWIAKRLPTRTKTNLAHLVYRDEEPERE